MKPRKLTLISGALLALLVVGTFVLISSIGQEPLIADQVKFTPKHIDMQNTPYLDVGVKLTVGVEPDTESVVEEVDPSTVQLEGMIAPTSSWIEYDDKGKPKRFHAEFAGAAVKGVIWHIIGHMGLTMPKPWNPLPIPLTITGQLYDGTQWEGTANIVVLNWAGGDPPPPPPP